MFSDFMLGARSRLLPASIPFRFFATAIAFHLLGWALILWGGDMVPGFVGGLGPALAGLHAVTLGTLAMTAMGAAYQLLPVATKRPVRSVAAARATHWLLTPGVLSLAVGFSVSRTWAMHLGATLVVAALALFMFLIADNLRRVDDMPQITGHAWQAIGSLLAVAALGVLLIVDFQTGFLPDHGLAGAAHAVAGGYGFMGMLVLGFSYVLIPMFGLSQAPNKPYGRWSVRLSAVALVLGFAGALAGSTPVMLLAGLAGLAAAGLHLLTMSLVMKARMRKELGSSFVLIRLGWAMLPISIVAGMVAATGWRPDITVPLFGFLLVFGWLLTFLTGVLQRIMPFLASMHSYRPGIKPVLVSALTAELPLKIHLWCHLAALAAVAAGIVAGQYWLVRLGATAGLAGAVAFAVFAAVLWQRLRRHVNPTPAILSESSR